MEMDGGMWVIYKGLVEWSHGCGWKLHMANEVGLGLVRSVKVLCV